MNLNQSNINILWGSLIVEELERLGVEYFCLSPGSRSTPLTVAVAYCEGGQKKIHFDERGAAYHALGYARATGRPAVLICTSGTAAANYMPAVVEASVDHLPLILLTADRPPELRSTGANQTIEQPGLYGRYVRWHFDMPCPDEKIAPSMILTTIDQAVYRSLHNPPGPVHINCMFREPLAPDNTGNDYTGYMTTLGHWNNSKRPYTTYSQATMTINDEALEQLLKLLNQTRRGLMLVGQLPHPQEYNAILKFAQRLGWPVFPDILSSLRLGYDFTDIISYYDRLLHSPKFTDRIQPDTILHLGGQITSKRLFQFIENSPPENYILINNYPERHDPIHKVTYRLQGDIVPTLNRLFSSVNPNPDEKWLPLFSTGNKVIHEILDNLTVDYETINEPAIARLLSKSIADNSGLFIASSMPIRDMDMYASPDGFRIPTGANRGVSGIDGTVASASGFACGLQKPVTLYCGDLALLHDINSLALLKDSPYPVTVVVINNNGGGIFSFLPIAGYTDIFEKYFATPHHLYFNKAADLFGLNYYQPKNLKAFVDDYQTAQTSGRSSLIEIIVDRQENQQFYRTLQKKIVTRLDELYK